jgi:hypothetical protein
LWIFLGLETSLKLFFKNQGSDCEIFRPRVDYPKVHRPFCNISEFNRNIILFFIGNPVYWVHGWWTTAGSHSPPWTIGGVDRRASGCGGTLVGVGPPATLGHGSSPAGAKNGGQTTGVLFQASPGLERR